MVFKFFSKFAKNISGRGRTPKNIFAFWKPLNGVRPQKGQKRTTMDQNFLLRGRRSLCEARNMRWGNEG